MTANTPLSCTTSLCALFTVRSIPRFASGALSSRYASATRLASLRWASTCGYALSTCKRMALMSTGSCLLIDLWHHLMSERESHGSICYGAPRNRSRGTQCGTLASKNAGSLECRLHESSSMMQNRHRVHAGFFQGSFQHLAWRHRIFEPFYTVDHKQATRP